MQVIYMNNRKGKENDEKKKEVLEAKISNLDISRLMIIYKSTGT